MSKNKHERRKAAAEAEGLLVEERLNFEAWRDSLETVPTIKARPWRRAALRAHQRPACKLPSPPG